jgi:hypothetical protein
MTKLDALIARARALPPEEQDALADQIALWLEPPAPPMGEGFADGSDEELAARVEAWRANPVGTPAAALHARLKAKRDAKR